MGHPTLSPALTGHPPRALLARSVDMSAEAVLDELRLDFTTEREGTVTRKGYVVRECPECGRLGERRARREGRRRITVVHTATCLRLPSGNYSKLKTDDACRFWEVTDDPQTGFGWGE